MAVTNKQLVDNVQASTANTAESIYTSPSTGKGTLVTNFSVANSTNIDRQYKAYIVTAGAAVPPTVPLVPSRTIVTLETDVPPEIAGQFMPAGAQIYIETSAANSISFTVSGREIT